MFVHIVRATLLSLSMSITILPSLISAGPISSSTSSYWNTSIVNRNPEVTVMTALVLKVAPRSFTCEGEPSAECRTAAQVAVAVTNAFREYRISDPGEIAALISLQAFESVNFRYNRNHGPGLPGQGTAAMLMPDLISKYAASIPAIAGKINGLPPEALLDLINANDDYNFGSAAWQLDTQCGSGVRINLHTIGRRSWEAWIKYCVGATIPPERVAYWHRACIAVADHFHLVEAKGKDKVPAFCS